MGESLIISDEQPRHRIRRTWQEECGKCVPALNCAAISPFHPEKPSIDFSSFSPPSQLISHSLQFSNIKCIQLQKDHSSLGQGISQHGRAQNGQVSTSPCFGQREHCSAHTQRAHLKGGCTQQCKARHQPLVTFAKQKCKHQARHCFLNNSPSLFINISFGFLLASMHIQNGVVFFFLKKNKGTVSLLFFIREYHQLIREVIHVQQRVPQRISWVRQVYCRILAGMHRARADSAFTHQWQLYRGLPVYKCGTKRAYMILHYDKWMR